MTQVWKFVVTDDVHGVAMPKGAKILTAHEQDGNICLWAEVQPNNESEFRYFEIFGTGHEMSAKDRQYIGTAFLMGGRLVFHVYEVK